MKNKIVAILAGICLLLSCEKIETVKTVNKDFVTNYETFWNLVNENYCFLGKAFVNDKNVDWQAVYDKWMPIVKNDVKEEYELFNIIGKSLDELRDGHIWMYSDFKHYSNNEYRLKPDGVSYYETNFISKFVQKNYLQVTTGKDDYKGDRLFRTPTGFEYGIIERSGKKILYLYHGSFRKKFNESDLAVLDPIMQEVDVFIYDIRENPGGSAILGYQQASFFFKEKQFVGYTAFKNGPGYDDFSEPTENYVIPSSPINWTDKPTALLIDREVYSTANIFASIMSQAPNVILVGQITGGGGGMPMSHFLPNGWEVVFSSNVTLGPDKKHIEGGIEPDFEASIGDDCEITKKDGVVEKAIEELFKKL